MPATGAVGMAVKGPVVHAQGGVGFPYRYRNGLGMMGSAEYAVFHDDFLNVVTSNVPAGWTAAIIDTGATAVNVTTATIGANGVIVMSDATADEGIAIYLPKAVQLISGKSFFMEMRVRTDDVTDNIVQFGLSDLTASTNPEDLWTTVAANLVTFGILDGSAYPQMLSDAGNGGTTVQTQTNKLMVADTWHTLAIGYDGTYLTGWVDGDAVLQWSGASTTIPTAVALAPFIGVLNGNGAGANVNRVDYFRFASER